MLDTNNFSDACVKCGKCIPNCTIHQISSDEATSPRGFLDLIAAVKAKELPLDKQTKAIFDSCFLCTNCVEICPSHIHVDTAIEAVRYEIALKMGIAWYKRLAFWLLSKRRVLDFLARLGYVFQSCGFKIQGINSFEALNSLNSAAFKDEKLSLNSVLNSSSNLSGANPKENGADLNSLNLKNALRVLKLSPNSNKNSNLKPNSGKNLDKISSKNLSKNLGMKARFSLPLVKKGRLFASLAQKSFLNSNPSFIDNGGAQSIGFFVGCLANYAYTSTAFAVLKIAKELKINVDLMKEQGCCAAPQYFTGDFKSVAKLAKKNIEYFEKKLEKLDFIIVPEATCSAMLNTDYAHFFSLTKELEWEKRAKKVAHKIILATQYFYDYTALEDLLKSRSMSELKITYHDPCHARKMQGVFKEPRELLRKNFNLVELSEPNTCCGFGGVSMQLENYDKALKVGLKKADDIQKTGAHIVSAECSACRMQISNALEQKGAKVLFQNPLELIASKL